MAESEQSTRQAEGESEEDRVAETGEKKLTGSVNEEAFSAPDVTYDATVLESSVQQETEGIGNDEKTDDGTVSMEEASGSAAKEEVVYEEAVEEEGDRRDGEEGRTDKAEHQMEKEDRNSADQGMEGSEKNQEKDGDVNQEEEKLDQDSEDKEEEWMDILGSGELKKKVLRRGKGVESRPTPQCRVKVRTKGVLEKGMVVDGHHFVPFTVGDGDVIQAWDLAVSLMDEGEVALVKTSHRFAYGKLGRPPNIPPDASITYELELLEVKEPVNFATIKEKELIVLIDRKRIRGNELFQRKEYEVAINSYDRALKLVESYIEEQSSQEMSETVADMRVRCLNNLAAAQLKVEMYKESQEACQKVLQSDPNNVKALFRYGKVLAIQGELSEAVKHLQKALELSPNEKAIQFELQRTVKKKDRVEKEERAMYKRMVEGAPKETETHNKAPRQDRWGPIPYLAIAAVVAGVGIGLAYFVTQR